MKQYKVFKHPSGSIEAVKQGLSWPAFFFTCIWAMVKKMWWLGVGVLIVNLVFVFIVKGTGGVVLIQIITAIVSLIFGAKGNSWRVKNLVSRGFEQVDTVTAAKPKSAVALYLNSTNGEFQGNINKQHEPLSALPTYENIAEVKKDVIAVYSNLSPAGRTGAIATVLAVIAGGMQYAASSLAPEDFFRFSFSGYDSYGELIIAFCLGLTAFSYIVQKKTEHTNKGEILAKVAVWGGVLLYFLATYLFYKRSEGVYAVVDQLKAYGTLLQTLDVNAFANSGIYGSIVMASLGLDEQSLKHVLAIAQGKETLYVFPSLGVLMYFIIARMLGKFAKQLRSTYV